MSDTKFWTAEECRRGEVSLVEALTARLNRARQFLETMEATAPPNADEVIVAASLGTAFGIVQAYEDALALATATQVPA